MRILRLWLAGLVLLAVHCGVSAQTISQPVDDGSVGSIPSQGQSFVATLNGTMTDIGLRPSTTGTVTLFIYASGSGSGLGGVLAGYIYRQDDILLTATTAGGPFRTFALATPVPVTAGQTYTFILNALGPMAYYGSTANPYPAGRVVVNYGVPVPGRDHAFQIFEVAPPPPAPPKPVAVPGLGAGAAAALAVLLACCGAFPGAGSRRRL
jgi:hypothetical protein